MVKQWHHQTGYQKRVRRLPSEGKLCYNAIDINSLVLVCVCSELQESLISSLSPHYIISCNPLIE